MSYQIVPAIIHGEQYIFVDTPGFGAVDINSEENHCAILTCLATLGSFTTPAGVLFMPDTRALTTHDHDLMTIQWIAAFCGPTFLRNVTVVISMWDRITEDDFPGHWALMEELKRDYLPPILDPAPGHRGGEVYDHGFPEGRSSPDAYHSILSLKRHGPRRAEELRAMIHRRYGGPAAADVMPQAAREMEAAKGDAMATEAAKVFGGRPIETEVRVVGGRAVVYDLQRSTPRGGRVGALAAPRVKGSLLLQDVPERAEQGRGDGHAQDQGRERAGGRGAAGAGARNGNQRRGWGMFWEWLDVAVELAGFFRGFRRRPAGRPAPKNAWDRLRGRFWGWWSGTA